MGLSARAAIAGFTHRPCTGETRIGEAGTAQCGRGTGKLAVEGRGYADEAQVPLPVNSMMMGSQDRIDLAGQGSRGNVCIKTRAIFSLCQCGQHRRIPARTPGQPRGAMVLMVPA